VQQESGVSQQEQTITGSEKNVSAAPSSAAVTNPAQSALVKQKAAEYSRAKEFVRPVGYFNIDALALRPNMTDLTMHDLMGKYVVLVDFWTYSCINCQRTLPYLNMWYDKYKKDGLIVVGVHTPEFSFEKDKYNIQKSLEKFGVHYPVLMDNNYDTWRAYGNRYWPHEYLIDIDGYIVHEHIGEGGYAETEVQIQKLLTERAKRLGKTVSFTPSMEKPKGAVTPGKIRTPEIYLGVMRNKEFIENAIGGKIGVQDVSEAPTVLKNDRVYVFGSWDFATEYMSNKTQGSSIVLNYGAKDVYMVLHAPKTIRAKLLLDGNSLGAMSGKDVLTDEKGASYVDVGDYRIYHLVSDPNGYSEHKLEIIISQAGLEAYTFTFG
jgi:thiol-disulfide isomerase/thioredoxin